MAAAVERLAAAPPLRQAPGPWALAAAVVAAALLLHALLWGLQAPLGRAPVAGSVVVAAGLVWAAWAAWLLRAGPPHLVDEGPYRYGRNPQILGGVVALIGAAAALGAPLLLAAAAALIAAAQRWHIPNEEAALRRAFGGWYSDYRASVRRWL